MEIQSKQNVAFWSLVASGGLALLKFIVAFFTGSLALLTEALHSLADFAATGLTLVAVKLGDRPADDNHHYGHGKIESLVALLETGLLVALAALIIYEAAQRLLSGATEVNFSWWAVAVLAVSIVVDYNRSRALARTAEATQSQALAADAVHFSSDMWSSLAVLIGFGLIYLGFGWADAVVALVVAAIILRACWQLGRSTIDTLIDTAPQGMTAALTDILNRTSGILDVEHVRVKPVGLKNFVSLGVTVPRTMPITEIVALKQSIGTKVLELYPTADITTTVTPMELDDETAFEQVMLIARHQGLAIHHLIVKDLSGRMAVSFDLEVEGELPLAEAHLQATRLEYAIRDKLGADVEVESHIEPLPQELLVGKEAKEENRIRVERILKSEAQDVIDIHNVRLREMGHELFLHYHCRFAPTTTVKSVHDRIDQLEERMKRAVPELSRVVAHAEPVGAKKHKL